MFQRVRPMLFLALVLLAACQPTPPAAPEAPAAPVAPAPPAIAAAPAAPDAKPQIPSLKLQTFAGQAYDLAEHRGRWVVVNFWATWCTPCLKEIPDLNAFDKARDDVDVIGLAYEEIERADMEAFLKEHPIEYPFAVVDTFNPPTDFDTPPGLPMTYLIAPDGKVAKQFLGPVTSEELAKLIDAAGKAAATP
jgi:thiol-disulfide isomerase/thioredoxin